MVDEPKSEDDEEYLLERVNDMPNYKKRFQKRILEKRKLQTRTKSRKMLKIKDQREDSEQSGGEEDILDLEFQISNDPKNLLENTDLKRVSKEHVKVLALIICSGLYPNIAIADEANYARPPTENVFHTKSKRFFSRFMQDLLTCCQPVCLRITQNSSTVRRAIHV